MFDKKEIMSRLAALERQNSRMKFLVGTMLLAASTLLLLGWMLPDSETIEAECLIIRDSQGRPRIRLDSREDCPNMVFCNERNSDLIVLRASGGTPAIILNDGQSHANAQFCLSQDGSSLSLSSKDGQTRIHIDAGKREPFISLSHKETGSVVHVSAHKDNPRVCLYHAESLRACLSLDKDGIPSLCLYDEQLNPTHEIPDPSER